ncbi:MAG: hypothetical protein JJU05_04285 [Verrucomicrobia bacterium]|nr:hypothetical protein [Verrucomicrobiota bacterium]MCH8525550.1 hypothetical protein [Kiritimatiellia bacterium]
MKVLPLIFVLTSAMTAISSAKDLHPLSSETGPVLRIGDRVTGKIDERIFGQFLERPSWGGETGPEAVVDDGGNLPQEVMEMLAGLRPPVIRFPGGTDVDKMNWTDMIDNAPDRESPERPVSIGGHGGEVTNLFGYDEFFRLRDTLDFEIILVGNLRQALYKERTLQDAALHEAGLLAYARAEAGAGLPEGMSDWGAIRARNGRAEPVPVRYFMVGNESFFFWPPQKPEQFDELGLADVDAAWDWFRECLIAYGRALKAVDPEVILILDGFHDPFNPRNDVPNAARRELYLDPEIRALYTLLGAHHYAPMGFHGSRLKGEGIPPADMTDVQIWYGLLAAPGLFDEKGQNIAVGDTYDEMLEAGYRISFTEWNFNAWNESRVLEERPFRIEVPARLATAGFLHGILRHGDDVALATQSMLLGTSWNITAIRADTKGEQPPYWLPQGQVARFYRHLTGSKLVESTLENPPLFEHPAQLTPWWPAAEAIGLLDVVVTRGEGTLYIHVINRSLDQSFPLEVDLPSEFQNGRATQHLLQTDPDLPFERDSTVPVQRPWSGDFVPGTSIRLPPHSLCILEITKPGEAKQ